MTGTGLESWVENSFDEFRRCETILEAYGREMLEAALGVDVRTWKSEHDLEELDYVPFSRDVLFFDNEALADSDDEDGGFGPPHFRNLVAMALLASFRIRSGHACG